MTHLALGFGSVTVVVVTGVVICFFSVFCVVWDHVHHGHHARWFEQPPVFLWHN